MEYLKLSRSLFDDDREEMSICKNKSLGFSWNWQKHILVKVEQKYTTHKGSVGGFQVWWFWVCKATNHRWWGKELGSFFPYHDGIHYNLHVRRAVATNSQFWMETLGHSWNADKVSAHFLQDWFKISTVVSVSNVQVRWHCSTSPCDTLAITLCFNRRCAAVLIRKIQAQESL